MEKALPAIPAKRYFTIGEVSELCGVKPYVLRYWEQEFTQLKPMKRRGNRRYYQHHEVLLIRRIRELLYEQGFTISGARNRMAESAGGRRHDDAERSAAEMARLDSGMDVAAATTAHNDAGPDEIAPGHVAAHGNGHDPATQGPAGLAALAAGEVSIDAMRQELQLIRRLLLLS